MNRSLQIVSMYLVHRFLILLVTALSAYGLNLTDLLPQSILEETDIIPLDDDVGLDIYQFLNKYGYPVESHEVTTEDGYILTLQRIPYGKQETNASDTQKPVVLLIHGFLLSSMDWVNLGPNDSLALTLADIGYDVWLGNNRGNTWSRKHVSLDPDTDEDFWDFSFDECGYYDLPAKIDYILNITGKEKLNYIGHSQGTSQFFALGSLRPEYNEKIILASALAPIVFNQNLTQPLEQFASRHWTVVEILLKQLGIYELLPKTEFNVEAIKILCNDNSIFQEVCADVIFFFFGEDSPQLDRSFIPVIGSNAPAGASAKMLIHMLQETKSGHYRRYDYGEEKNLEVYNQTSPPDYNLTSVDCPVALYYAKNDALAAVVNVEQLADKLPNLVKQNLVEYELFNHVDFVWATDVKTIVYDDVIALLNGYNSIS